MARIGVASAALSLLLAGAALAQQQAAMPGGPQAGPQAGPGGFQPTPGYLGDRRPDAAVFLPAPPAADSALGEAELQIFRDTRALEGSSRWAMAASDAAGDSASMWSAFACSLGAQIAPDQVPAAALLIRRILADASPIIGQQKDFYSRPRPFTVAEGATCVDAEDLRDNGSYPSGHSTVGWSWALALAELAPDRAGQIAARGRAFGESRVVCGVHYPSDVEAGQLTVVTVMAAIQTDPDFIAERDAARAELDAVRASAPAPDAAQCAAEAALTATTPW